ncbi:cistern family PEP-CTERM protein [Sphingomonas sp. Root710]|uniref:cistern family PEP-CTERM protein n=1 Tax=Sphingomonas sp. Root710 TaxID=1736594 RepID=UPI00138F3DD7|nr:cistern family PEP-CTERM protein [Sphingomonas sp. Root710]
MGLVLLLTMGSTAPLSAAEYYPMDWSEAVTVDKDDIGMNFTIDFSGKAGGDYTNKLSAAGDFTFTGVTNAGRTFNFDYSLTNTSSRTSRIRAFGFDTSGTLDSLNATGAFTWEYKDVAFPEQVGTMDACFAAGSGCTNHASGGVTRNNTGSGSFALTFATAMESVDLERFSLKFVGLSQNINGQNWGVGLGSIGAITAGAGPGDPITAPEPATWLMMILGFGLIGYRQRKQDDIRGQFSFLTRASLHIRRGERARTKDWGTHTLGDRRGGIVGHEPTAGRTEQDAATGARLRGLLPLQPRGG